MGINLWKSSHSQIIYALLNKYAHIKAQLSFTLSSSSWKMWKSERVQFCACFWTSSSHSAFSFKHKSQEKLKSMRRPSSAFLHVLWNCSIWSFLFTVKRCPGIREPSVFLWKVICTRSRDRALLTQRSWGSSRKLCTWE